ncbi:MAG: haloacid dehalogenase [Flavobacteriales bacterium]|nr:haloacid dehalogenase [Flavobacteriales bacterium]
MKNTFSILLLALLIGACQNPNEEVKEKQKTEIKDDVVYLASWNDGTTKHAIIDFVEKTTTKGSPDFIPVKDRIATFDNDGNLWSEQPLYFQFLFAADRVKQMANDHPEWQEEQPFKAILEGDYHTALAGGTKSLLEIVMASHSGLTTEEFDANVKEWLATAKHPKTGMHYNEMIYQPMVELLEYLRANDYKTFIVSGGGIDFMRVWVEEAYGIPPYQVVGSSGKVAYKIDDAGEPQLVKQSELNFIDDKEGKPVGIHQHIGKRPIIASGNSDGDYQMLEWTTSADGYPRLGLLLHHTDSVREFAYDRESHIGRLNKGLDDAGKMGWLVIDMKEDWNTVYEGK